MLPHDHSEFPGLIYCRKCGRSAGYDSSKINNQLSTKTNKIDKWCKQSQLARDQWAEKPIRLYQYSKDHMDKFRERWCTEPIQGHTLSWNEQLGVHRFTDEEGLVTCTRCHQCWPTDSIARNPGSETVTCEGTPQTIKDWTDRTKPFITKWNRDNQDKHKLYIDDIRHRWRCERCGLFGTHVISNDKSRKKSYGKPTAQFLNAVAKPCNAATLRRPAVEYAQSLLHDACRLHADREPVT